MAVSDDQAGEAEAAVLQCFDEVAQWVSTRLAQVEEQDADSLRRWRADELSFNSRNLDSTCYATQRELLSELATLMGLGLSGSRG